VSATDRPGRPTPDPPEAAFTYLGESVRFRLADRSRLGSVLLRSDDGEPVALEVYRPEERPYFLVYVRRAVAGGRPGQVTEVRPTLFEGTGFDLLDALLDELRAAGGERGLDGLTEFAELDGPARPSAGRWWDKPPRARPGRPRVRRAELVTAIVALRAAGVRWKEVTRRINARCAVGRPPHKRSTLERYYYAAGPARRRAAPGGDPPPARTGGGPAGASFPAALPDDVWEAVRGHLPQSPPGPAGGRPRAGDRACFEAAAYCVLNGLPFRRRPAGGPSPVTVWRRHAEWVAGGAWDAAIDVATRLLNRPRPGGGDFPPASR
jgi:transposase